MTRPANVITFGPFRLDQEAVRLWRGEAPVALQPRPLAVLSYLAARPGEVVGRDEILARVWEGTAVTKAVLKVAVRAVREALDDPVAAPRFIETVGRTGYRFIGSGGGAPAGSAASAATAVVGRERELAALHRALTEAEQARRRLVVVSGEAGIGKTTLLDRFAAEVGRTPAVAAARGQCLEHYGEGEPYLPLLDALGRLARDGDGAELGRVLRRYAPSWVTQLPAVAGRATGRRRQAAATGPTRMLRELSDALEVFTRKRTLVLLLEDLHWSDHATVDLLSFLARRRDPARLLIVGSTRAAELIVHQHPLRAALQELRAGGYCEELPLELLSLDEVMGYVERRFPGVAGDVLRRIAARLHQRTEGNALFMINMLDDLVAQGVLVRRDDRWQSAGTLDAVAERVPVGLQDLISRRIDALPEAARQTLEAASVAGDPFTVASVAAALGEPAEAVEEACEALAGDGGLIAEDGAEEWPDGTVTDRYQFLHALYRHVLYQRIGAARRVRMHRAIGLREEAGFGSRAGERAAQLAMHFTRGREPGSALAYHQLAAGAALGRQAPHEAVSHCSAALAALAAAGEVADGTARELRLVVTRATLHMATRGYAADETVRDYARARELCGELRDATEVFPVVRGLLSYHHVRGDLPVAHELGEELLGHAARHPDDRCLVVQAHYGHGATLFHEGALSASAEHLQRARGDYDPSQHATHARVYGGYDPGVACALWLAWTRAMQGELADAAALDRDGLALARSLPDAFSLAWACYGAGVSRQLFGDLPGAEALLRESMQLAEEHGFPHVLGMAMAICGWTQLMQGRGAAGIALLRRGVAVVEETGAALMRPSYFGMLATADLLEGDRAAAARRYEEAIAAAEASGERVHLAPVLIGRSHLLAGGGPGGRASRATDLAAEASLEQALAVAREQGARLIELRAAVALARHYEKTGRGVEGRSRLRAVHEWFAERPALAPEVVAARQLLQR